MEALLILGAGAVINHLTGGALVNSLIEGTHKTAEKYNSEGRGTEASMRFEESYKNWKSNQSKKDEY